MNSEVTAAAVTALAPDEVRPVEGTPGLERFLALGRGPRDADPRARRPAHRLRLAPPRPTRGLLSHRTYWSPSSARGHSSSTSKGRRRKAPTTMIGANGENVE